MFTTTLRSTDLIRAKLGRSYGTIIHKVPTLGRKEQNPYTATKQCDEVGKP